MKRDAGDGGDGGIAGKVEALTADRQRDESLLVRGLFHLFNIVLAAIVMLLLSPVYLALVLLMKSRGQGPVWYKGVRLGRHKKEFIMYKFRTLPVDTQQQLGSELLSEKHQLLTPLTRLLRDTRLDELPQLLNVLKRDMDFIGPRPVRPEVYEQKCRWIINYELRFRVRPGLIGYSQLFTPHGAPKRLRAHLDNQLVIQNRDFIQELKTIFFAFYVLGRSTIRRAVTLALTLIKIRLLKGYTERRLYERVKLRNAYACVVDADKTLEKIRIVDINEYYLKVLSDRQLPEQLDPLSLRITCERGVKLKRKRAYCSARLFKKLPIYGNPDLTFYIFEYQATSEMSQYVVDQYFLRKSIA